MDVGEGQTRGTETWESSIRTWVERGFPLKSEAQEGDGEGKVEKGFLLGRLRCLSPTPFPHGHGKGAMLLSALCRERGVAIPLGLGPTFLLPLCLLLRRTIRCLPVATRFLLPGLWERTRCKQLKKLRRKCGYDVCSEHPYLGAWNLGKEIGRGDVRVWGAEH